MSRDYSSESLQVLSGLEPVRLRPGMYTDTARPNHLVQEVVDNSVDEALGGHARDIEVTLHADGAISVADDGRGMPVDVHPEHGVPGVELILTRLHAGAKFDHESYEFAGGLHGVGVSVVNALSTWLEIEVWRDGALHQQRYEQGEPVTTLVRTASAKKRQTGTRVRFLPDPQFFDSVNLAREPLAHLLRAKAVLCPGLSVRLTVDDDPQASSVWLFEAGLTGYLEQALEQVESLPAAAFTHDATGNDEAVAWALKWLPDGGPRIAEAYVNLIPTPAGGTHVNGLRAGLTEALREFCEFRGLTPRGLKLAGEDLWEQCAYVLSAKLKSPQFSGQTKERLSSRASSAFIGGIAKDAFSLWLNANPEEGEAIAELALSNARRRAQTARTVARKKVAAGPALPGKLADCAASDAAGTEIFLVEGDSAGGSARQARDRTFQAVMPLRGKILNTWEVDAARALASQEVHDIAVAIGVEPGSDNLDGLRYERICVLADADSDGAHIATLLCALFLRHFRPVIDRGHVHVAMPPLYRIDVGKEVYYALDDAEKQGVLDRIAAEKKRATPSVQRFKGLGEMNPKQLRETTMHPDTRRLVRLTLDGSRPDDLMDMLLAKDRARDRRQWLESRGHEANAV